MFDINSEAYLRDVKLWEEQNHIKEDALIKKLVKALQSAERIVSETDSPDGDLVYSKIAKALESAKKMGCT